MVLKFSVKIDRFRSAADLPTRQVNLIIKQGLETAAREWVRQFLPLHFGPGATQRYGYAARSRRTLQIKQRANSVRRWRSSIPVPIPRPNGALVWTGDLKEEATRLARDPDSAKLTSSGASGKEYVRVRIKLPHPMRPQNAEELTRLITSELTVMQRIAMNVMFIKLNSSGGNVSKKIAV